MKNPYKDYIPKFSVNGLWRKIGQYSKQAGVKVVYSALLLFYAFRRKETPLWAKNIIVGTLGYFLAPIDMLPDLSPIIGYTDDLGVLSFGLVTVAAHINMDVKEKARGRLTKWFGAFDHKQLAEIDKQF